MIAPDKIMPSTRGVVTTNAYAVWMGTSLSTYNAWRNLLCGKGQPNNTHPENCGQPIWPIGMPDVLEAIQAGPLTVWHLK